MTNVKFKKGQIPWNKGVAMQEESKRKLSESLKKRFEKEEVWNKGKSVQTNTGKTHFKKGQIPWNKGKKPSKETIEKQKITWKNTFLSNPDVKKKMSESKKGKIPWIKGKTHTTESLSKMSKTHKGQVAWNKGRTYYEEERKKISEATKKAMNNPEIRKKISQARKGMTPWHKGRKGVYSEEVLKKWSKSHKLQMANPKIREKVSISLKKTYSSNPEILRRMSEAQRKRMSNPEIREILRKNTLKMYESGSFPKQTNTKPERQIKEELLKRGYKEGFDFIHQYKFMNKFMCDFCFPNKKIIIEVDGDFWHANPNKYPEESQLYKHQLKGRGRDKSKNAYISKFDNGTWTLLRFWESDIKKDVSKCVDRIEEVLVNKILI